MINLTDQGIEAFYSITQQRAILENESYIIIETPDGINSMSLEVFLKEYRYVYNPLTRAILPCC